MPWKYFQWRRWMALKKTLCICLQNKEQGLDKDREPGMLSLQSKDSDTCAGGWGGSALPCSPGTTWITAIPVTTELTCLVTQPGCVSLNCQPCHRAMVFYHKWRQLVLLLEHGDTPRTQHIHRFLTWIPAPSLLWAQGSKLRPKCHYLLWTMCGYKDWALRN